MCVSVERRSPAGSPYCALAKMRSCASAHDAYTQCILDLVSSSRSRCNTRNRNEFPLPLLPPSPNCDVLHIVCSLTIRIQYPRSRTRHRQDHHYRRTHHHQNVTYAAPTQEHRSHPHAGTQEPRRARTHAQLPTAAATTTHAQTDCAAPSARRFAKPVCASNRCGTSALPETDGVAGLAAPQPAHWLLPPPSPCVATPACRTHLAIRPK